MTNTVRQDPITKVHEAEAEYLRQRLTKGMTVQAAQRHLDLMMVRQEGWVEAFGSEDGWPCTDLMPSLQKVAGGADGSIGVALATVAPDVAGAADVPKAKRK